MAQTGGGRRLAGNVEVHERAGQGPQSFRPLPDKAINGARVGDLFMSIIHTAELDKIDVFGYLVAVQRPP